MRTYRMVLMVLMASAGLVSGQEHLRLELKPERPAMGGAAAETLEPSSAAARGSAQSGGKGKATEITSSGEATFDEKSRKATFTGDVVVKDPEFTMTSDRLTAYLRRSAVKRDGVNGKPEAAEKAGGAASGSGSLERAVAEGNVVFVQESTDEKGDTTRSTGKAAKAEFDGATGDVTLTGWPQVQQGINTHVASEESTVMVLNRDGRMKTRGRSKTVITEEPAADRRVP